MTDLLFVISWYVVLFLILPCSHSSVIDEESYWKAREKLLLSERNQQMPQSESLLGDKETLVNDMLMEMKRDEYKRDPFLPSIHFFHAYREIEKTPIFQVLKALPKGEYRHHLQISFSAPSLTRLFFQVVPCTFTIRPLSRQIGLSLISPIVRTSIGVSGPQTIEFFSVFTLSITPAIGNS